MHSEELASIEVLALLFHLGTVRGQLRPRIT